MKKRWRYLRYVYLIVWMLSCLSGANTHAFAEEAGPGFSYHIEYPENQLDPSLGYYKLRMKPGQVQTLTIQLSNPSNQALTVQATYSSAKTNSNGVIEYGASSLAVDKTMRFPFDQLVDGPEEVTLSPGETSPLKFTLTMPTDTYDGVIAGGIQLQVKKEKEKESSGTQVINEYAYVFGVVLQENDTQVEPEVQFRKIQAGQTNFRNVLNVGLSNSEAAYLNDLTIAVQVKEKGKEPIVYERKQTDMRMAPNSVIDFPVSLNGDKLVAGDYSGTIEVTSGNRHWQFEQDFTITPEEAAKYNAKDVSLVQETGISWWLIAGVAVGLFVLIGGWWWLWSQTRKKRRKQAKKNKRPGARE